MLTEDSPMLAPFYRAAAVGLRVLDARGARRRFGPDADARWRQFRGALHEGDRMDLLLRDAATSWPLAFAPRDVFALEGLSVEDPFGAEWPGPPRGLAGTILRDEGAGAATDVVRAFDAAVDAWGVSPPAVASERVPRVAATTRIVVGGVGALRALVAVFAAGRDQLDLADQALFVTGEPRERQLFGLASLFLGVTSAPRLVAPGADVAKARAVGFQRADAAFVSDDATGDVRATVAALTSGLSR